MTPEFVAALIGAGISILFKVVTPLDDWLYYKVTDKYRGLVMFGIVVGVAAGAFLLGCINLLQLSVACDWVGAGEMAKSLFFAVATNQIAFLVTPKSTAKVAIAEAVITEKSAEVTAEIKES